MTTKTYPRELDADMAAALAREQGPGASADRYAMPFPQAREALLAQRRLGQTGAPAMVSIEDELLQTEGRSVGLRWLLPRPHSRRDDDAIVYLHGGGWCVGSNDTHDTILRHLAHASGKVVCGVDYALAPEHPFPAALRDVEAVLDRLMAVPERRLALAGDSAGANLALVETMRRRDDRLPMPQALLLYYGVYGPLREGGSFAAYGDGRFGLSCAAQRRYLRAYLGAEKDSRSPRIYPLLGTLDGLPPAWILAAGLDLLRDDSVDLYAAWRQAGSEAKLHVAEGLPHGYLNHAATVPAAARDLATSAAFAAKMLDRPG